MSGAARLAPRLDSFGQHDQLRRGTVLTESQVYRSGRQLMPMHIVSNGDVEWAQPVAQQNASTAPQAMAVLSVDC